MVIHTVAARLRREATPVGDGAVSIEGQILRTYDALVEFVSDRLGDDDDPPRLGGPGHRHRHGQRVPAPAAVVAASRCAASCAATSRTPRRGG